MKHLKEILEKRLKEMGLSKQTQIVEIVDKIKNYLVRSFDQKIVDQEIQNIYIKDNNLYIVCQNPSFKQEIMFKKQKILEILEEYQISEIFFR